MMLLDFGSRYFEILAKALSCRAALRQQALMWSLKVKRLSIMTPRAFYLPYHEPPLVVEWQRHTYSFLLDTKPLWHRRKWKSWPASEGDPWPWHRSSGGCPLCRFETTGQLLHPAAGSNQVGCSCTWQRSLFRKTNTGATEEIPALNQSWRGSNHPISNRPYKGHQVPYLVPRTTDYLSPLWSNTDHWPYAPGVCRVTGMPWWILHSWLIEYPLRDNSRDLHGGIPARSGILLSDMTQLISTGPQTWTI